MLQLGKDVTLYLVALVLVLLGTLSPVWVTALTASLYLFMTMFSFPQVPTSRALQMLHPLGSGNVSVVAHRCGGHDAPENTIVAIQETGTSIPSLLEGSPEGAVGVHQPKLVCFGHPSTTAQYIIIAKNEKVAIPLQEKLFTLEHFNDRLVSFDYGFANEKNKPSVILNLRTSENPIKQTTSRMWCLLLFLPFLIGDFISEHDQHWKLFLLLREICSIVFAPVVSYGLSVFLKQLVIDRHHLFKSLYPDRPLIPKHHFMTHYWRMMMKFGPLLKLWCMRFESKHGPLKRHAHAVCNFINISKTLANKNQVQSMFNWKFNDPLTKKMTVPNAFPVMVGSLEKSDLLIENLKELGYDIGTCSTIHVAPSVCLLGQIYRTGCVLALNCDFRGERLFGEIVHLVPNCEKEEVLIFLRILTVKYFDDHLYSYVVERNDEYEMINVKDICMKCLFTVVIFGKQICEHLSNVLIDD